jgi:hypothetical protein
LTMNSHNKVEYFGKAKVGISPFCPSNRIFMLQTQDIHYLQLVSFEWVKEDKASNIWQKVDGKHIFEATAWCANEHILLRRNLHAQIEDLNT